MTTKQWHVFNHPFLPPGHCDDQQLHGGDQPGAEKEERDDFQLRVWKKSFWKLEHECLQKTLEPKI